MFLLFCLGSPGPFSKGLGAGEGGARLLAVATAKYLGGVSFCQAFSLRLWCQRKSGWSVVVRLTGIGERISLSVTV